MAIADYLRKLVELKNQLAANLRSMGVTADENEKLNTLVPKVLECKTEQNVEFDENCAIISANIPGSVTNISSGAFKSIITIKSVTIPDSVMSIGEYAFQNCTSLESVTIPDSVTSIGNDAFENCTSLTHIEIPGSITDIAYAVFYGCTSLISVNVGYGFNKFGSTNANFGYFQKCSNLKSIIIPHSVDTIGGYTFAQCYKLANIYYTGTQTQWNNITKGTNWNSNMGSDVSGGTVVHYNYKTWEEIQTMVRNGTIQNYYSIGDQFPVNYNGNVVMFDIVAFDVAIPANSNYTHSMTIMPHDCIDNLMIDNAEPDNSDSDIAAKGNNRYAYSGIRQYLNSDKAAGEWWTAQHSTDTAPDYATTKAGFMSRFDSNFLSVIGKTRYRVAKNTITDGGGYEDLEDFFYLPSKMEVGLGTENGISEGALFPYFDSADKRIKNYGSNTQVQWWLRTPQNGVSYNTVVTGHSTGAIYIANSKSDFAIAPVCNII